jgi:N-acetylglucosamine-6-phosphate deacetylase
MIKKRKRLAMSEMQGIQSVKLVLPDRVMEDAWVWWNGGLIAGFGQGSPPIDGEFAHGKNRYLAAGFIDMHVHGGMGADFLDNTEESFERISRFHLAGGTTALCPTLATATYEHIHAVMATYCKSRPKSAGHLLPLHLEGPHLAPGKAGAQDPKLMTPPAQQDIQWLVENAANISQITMAPELPNALELVARAAAAGICVSIGHTEATEEQANAAVKRGARKATHLYNAMSSAAKHGLFRRAGVTEYALTEDALTCELIGDGFHVAPTLARLAYCCKGAGKIALVSDALAGAGLAIGTNFFLGKLACRTEDGFCALADGSALSGSATRLIDHVRVMVEKVGAAVHDAVRMATLTPATTLGIDQTMGGIAVGKAADLVSFDDSFCVQKVWIGGRIVFANDSA